MSSMFPSHERSDSAVEVPTGPVRGPVEAYGAWSQASPRTTNTMAILSVVFSALGFFTGITAIPGVILGHLALSSIKKNPNQEGHSMAITGLALGYTIIGIAVAAILLFALVIGGIVAALSRG